MFSFQNSDSALADEVVDPLLRRLRDKLPRPLVFTDGVFDILHVGHLTCLDEARRHGRSLVVGIHSDASARRLGQGTGLPLNNAVDRARMVGALSSVSAVVLFDDDKPLALIRALVPQVYVKAGDPDDVARLEESRLLAQWDGRTVTVPRVHHVSLSALVERLLAVPAGPARKR